jgi:hypothetical protein
MPYYEKAQRTADEFKSVLNDTIIDSNLKQETLGHYGFVHQNTISQWLNPELDRHMPAFQFFMQPKEIVLPLCEKIVERFGKQITTIPKGLKTDGSFDDNLLNMNVLEGELTKVKDTDTKKVLEWCSKLELELATIRAEALRKLNV